MQQLKKALQGYSSSNDVAILVETVRDIYQNQKRAISYRYG